jgi:type I restriction enzyme S subunit
MTSDWPISSIAECAANEPYSTQIGPFGEKIRAEIYTQEGAPVLRGTNVNPEGRFHDDDFVFINSELADKEFDKFVCEADDVILCHKGTLGKIGIIPKQSRFKRYIMGNSMMKVRCNKSKLEPLFLYYWLCSREGQEYLFSRVSQVGVPQIQRPLTTLREASFPLPQLPEQKAIAQILGALDDKIELNRRMNETLEAMAQALFKSWFVDTTQANLPKGWRVGALGEVADNPRRGVQADQIKTATSYIGLEHMPRRSIALSDWGNSEKLESNKFEFKRGEILFGKLRPYFHKVGVAPLDGICSTDILVIAPKETEWFGFLLGHVSSVDLVNHTNAASTGTKMPRACWNDIARFQVAIPPKDLAAAFTERIHPMIERIIANIHESRTLAALRDTLLPKLLSGELRVPTAAKLEEVSR